MHFKSISYESKLASLKFEMLFTSRGIDGFAYFGNPGGRDPAEFRVPPDDGLIFRQVDAKRFVGGNEGLLPLNTRSKLA